MDGPDDSAGFGGPWVPFWRTLSSVVCAAQFFWYFCCSGTGSGCLLATFESRVRKALARVRKALARVGNVWEGFRKSTRVEHKRESNREPFR